MPIPIKVVTKEEAESMDVVVCGDKAMIPGCLEAVCSICKARIVVSPTSPAKPPKICLKCIPAWTARDKAQREAARQQSFPA